MEHCYLFIDGGFLNRFVCEMAEKARYDAFDYDVQYHRIGSNFDRVFFYDALPEKRDNQDQEEFDEEYAAKEMFLDNIALIPNWNVRPALTRRGGRREQKGVDVLLAIECLMHATRNEISAAAIMTSDLDFYPLFENLLQTKTKSELICHKGKTNKYLIQSADHVQYLDFSSYAGWLDKSREKGINPSEKITGTMQLDRRVGEPLCTQISEFEHKGSRIQILKDNPSGMYFPRIDGIIGNSTTVFKCKAFLEVHIKNNWARILKDLSAK